jgi:hypothetical protein
MKQYFSTLSLLAVSMMGMFAPNVKADEWNKQTNITINHAIEVEGHVLPAGSYVLRLVNGVDRHVVQVFNAQENHLVATVFAISAERLAPSGKSEFSFYESGSGETPALRTWFYPGDTNGFEFRDIHKDSALAAARSGNAVAPIVSSN